MPLKYFVCQLKNLDQLIQKTLGDGDTSPLTKFLNRYCIEMNWCQKNFNLFGTIKSEQKIGCHKKKVYGDSKAHSLVRKEL